MSHTHLPDWAREIIAYRVPATNLSLAISYIAGVYGIWQGTTIIVSERIRFQNPVYHIMDGHAPYWGIVVLLCGAAVLHGLLRRKFLIKALGLLGLSAWHAIFAIASLRATLTIAEAASTPGPVYTFVAVTLAVLVWMDEKRLTYATAKTRDR